MLLHSLCCFFARHIHAHQEAENSSKKAPSKSQDLEQKFFPRVHRQAFHAFSVALETGACASFPYAFVTLRVSLLAFSDHLPQSAGSSALHAERSDAISKIGAAIGTIFHIQHSFGQYSAFMPGFTTHWGTIRLYHSVFFVSSAQTLPFSLPFRETFCIPQ